jgi:hypothetical protein
MSPEKHKIILLLFGTDGSDTAENVGRRWDTCHKEKQELLYLVAQVMAFLP